MFCAAMLDCMSIFFSSTLLITLSTLFQRVCSSYGISEKIVSDRIVYHDLEGMFYICE
jgi:hypothetical protein